MGLEQIPFVVELPEIEIIEKTSEEVILEYKDKQIKTQFYDKDEMFSYWLILEILDDKGSILFSYTEQEDLEIIFIQEDLESVMIVPDYNLEFLEKYLL